MGNWNLWGFRRALFKAAFIACALSSYGQAVSYDSLVLAESPLVYYRFEEPSGLIVANSGSLGAAKNALCSTNGVTRGRPSASPALGRAIDLDGVRGWVQTPEIVAGTLGALTIEFWLYRRPEPRKPYIGLFASDGFDSQELHFNLLPGGPQLQVGVSGASGTVLGIADLLRPSAWHHIAASYQVQQLNGISSALVRIFVDGKVAVFGTNSPVNAKLAPSRIGAWFDNTTLSRFLDGAIDEFAIYDHVLPDAAIASHFQAGSNAPVNDYSKDFSGVAGAEWSTNRISVTPSNGRRYLGDFGNQTVRLSLSNLPPHKTLRLSFDFFAIRTWDGNSTGNGLGPDLFTVQLGNGATLLHASFHTGHPDTFLAGQSYPTAYPGTRALPDNTAASEIDSLGYRFGNDAFDAVWPLEFTFGHADSNLVVNFSASGLQAATDETWGLDNVKVDAWNTAAGVIETAAPYAYVDENGGQTLVQVNRVGGSAGAVSVAFQTVPGDAIPGSDFQPQSGVLNFADGELSKTVTIPIINDTQAEGWEAFQFLLDEPKGGAALGRRETRIVIVDDDANISFSRTNFVATELNGWVPINVHRSGSTRETASIRLRTISGTALAGQDFANFDGRIVFAPGAADQTAWIEILDDRIVEPDEFFDAQLLQPSLNILAGSLTVARVAIADDDAAAREGRGASWNVSALALGPGATNASIIGGFNFINGVARRQAARLNMDGSLDPAFDPAAGFNVAPSVLTPQPDKKLLAGGQFASYRGVARNRIARIQADGLLDSTFNPGLGANDTIEEIVLLPDGKIIVAGGFTTFNGTARARVARLNTDGSLDNAFNPGTGSPAYIWAAAAQADGKVILSGDFTTFNGTPRSRIVRLNADGSVDNTFAPSLNGICNDILVLPDGSVILTGWFTTVNGATRNRIARVSASGTVDAAFNPGAGPDRSPWHVRPARDGKLLVSGPFSTWNGLAKAGLIRLNSNGSADASWRERYGASGLVTPGYSGELLAVNDAQQLADSSVLAVGNFRVFEGLPAPRIILLDNQGQVKAEPLTWTQWTQASGGNGHWYALTARPASWVECDAEAGTWLGHLASITTAAEQNFINRTFLRGPHMIRPLWIGLTDQVLEGSFLWSTGEPLSYRNWAAGEPNNNGNEDYASVNWQFSYDPSQPAAFGQWNDNKSAGSFEDENSFAGGPYYGIIEAETDPSLPLAPPAFAGATLESSTGGASSLRLSFSSVAGLPVILESSTNLLQWSVWQILTANERNVLIPVETSSRRFFRLRLER